MVECPTCCGVCYQVVVSLWSSRVSISHNISLLPPCRGTNKPCSGAKYLSLYLRRWTLSKLPFSLTMSWQSPCRAMVAVDQQPSWLIPFQLGTFFLPTSNMYNFFASNPFSISLYPLKGGDTFYNSFKSFVTDLIQILICKVTKLA